MIPKDPTAPMAPQTKFRIILALSGFLIVFFIGASYLTDTPSPSTSPAPPTLVSTLIPRKVVVDGTTTCAFTTNAFNAKDKITTKAIFEYKDQVLESRDRELNAHMVQGWSKDGHDKVVIDVMGLCDKHQTSTIREEALKVHALFYSMGRSMGLYE